MIGKPEWFSRRKYGGWGLVPKTWQGWVYTLLIVAPIIVLQAFVVNTATLILLGIWMIVVTADFIHIMAHVAKDEREILHEAIAERNALWAIIAVLAMGVAFQVSHSVASGTGATVDPVILTAIFTGLIVKAVTNIYLDKKD